MLTAHPSLDDKSRTIYIDRRLLALRSIIFSYGGKRLLPSTSTSAATAPRLRHLARVCVYFATALWISYVIWH